MEDEEEDDDDPPRLAKAARRVCRTNFRAMRFIERTAADEVDERKPKSPKVKSAKVKYAMSETKTKDTDYEARTTTDHKAIRKWAEDRGGRPATVRATEEDGHAGVLRIDFDPKQKALEPIAWTEFFAKFEESKLALLYQDHTKDGGLSRFHKFVHRASAR